MSEKKKDKKNGVEKLRKVLDDYSFEELSPKDEKYLRTLRQRLDEKSQREISFKKINYDNEESSEEDLLKPKVVIHERIQKKIVELPEFKEVEKPSAVETKKELSLKDDDLIDIRKVESNIPEFVEVKPKKVKKEEKVEEEASEEEFVPIDEEEIERILEEEEPLEEKEETVEFIKVEPEKREVETEEISEWEAVDSGKYITEETSEPVKEDESYNEEYKIIEIFKDIDSIDKETAIILYNNGYTDIEKLKTATAKDLAKIKGIKRKKAKQIKEELEEPEPETWELKPETTEEEPVEKQEEKVSEAISVNETIYCRECGFTIESEMIFCPKCGTRLLEEDDLEKPTKIKEIDISDTAEKEVTKEEIEQVEDEITLEEKLKPFEGLESITKDIAVSLYDNGYITFDLLKNVEVNDLRKIKGIKRKTAKKIREEIDEKIIESARVKPITISKSSEGEVTKEQIEKQEDFEEEKQPLHPVELSHNKEWQPLKEELEPMDDKEIGEEIEKEIKEEIEVEPEEDTWELKPETTEEAVKKDKTSKRKELGDFEKIQIFKEFKSIDDETAIKLYDYGFTSIELLKLANLQELKKVKGLKRKKAKGIIKEIEGLHAEDKIGQMVMEEDEEYFKDETFFEEESKELDSRIEEFKEKEEPVLEEELFIEEEIIEDLPETKIEEGVKDLEKNNEFSKIPSIDKKISDLLYENNIKTIQDLSDATIRDLTKIKGIKRKKAKQIKKEIKEHLENIDSEEGIKSIGENPYIKDDDFSEEDEWESFEEPTKKEKKSSKKGFMHGDYALYKREIATKNGKKRTVRFFSKGEPEDAEPIKLPKGYEVKENKKTGVPYLKKGK